MADCTKLGDQGLRVPTFYSSDDHDHDDEGIPFLLAVCIATGFGAIHCIAWSFHFTTLQERWAWRISAILVSALPISLILVALLCPTFVADENKPIWMELYEDFMILIMILMSFLYIIARIILLVLPFVALRALPPDAYVQLDWVSFLPHI